MPLWSLKYSQICLMWPSKGTLTWGCIRQMVAKYRFNSYEMHCEVKLNLRSHYTKHCLIEVVTKADLTVDVFHSHCNIWITDLVIGHFGQDDLFWKVQTSYWQLELDNTNGILTLYCSLFWFHQAGFWFSIDSSEGLNSDFRGVSNYAWLK